LNLRHVFAKRGLWVGKSDHSSPKSVVVFQ
jgi:hypothetical protein